MQLQIEVRGLTEALKFLHKAADGNTLKAIERAENLTAWDIRKKLIEVMPRVIKDPTPTTLKALLVDKNVVEMKNDWGKGVPADKYLGPQVFGGARTHKKFEKALIRSGVMAPNQFAVPTDQAKLDKYGNLRGAQVVQILSGLRAFTAAGYNANATGSKRSLAKGNAVKYHASPLGIWQRAGRMSKLIIAFVDSAPRYRKRLPFFQVAERVAKERYPVNLRRAWYETNERGRR